MTWWYFETFSGWRAQSRGGTNSSSDNLKSSIACRPTLNLRKRIAAPSRFVKRLNLLARGSVINGYDAWRFAGRNRALVTKPAVERMRNPGARLAPAPLAALPSEPRAVASGYLCASASERRQTATARGSDRSGTSRVGPTSTGPHSAGLDHAHVTRKTR